MEMRLLRQIGATRLMQLSTTRDVVLAEAYEACGWVVLKHGKMLKGLTTYGQLRISAHITDAGRAALERERQAS